VWHVTAKEVPPGMLALWGWGPCESKRSFIYIVLKPGSPFFSQKMNKKDIVLKNNLFLNQQVDY
jgi:hypothetical protein